MLRALAIEGWIIGLFVIFNGIYVILFPPSGDEPQGYAIIAIGIFIILATLHLDRIMEKIMKAPRPSKNRPPVAGYISVPDLSHERR